MKQNSDYKNEALAALKGNWGPSVLAIVAYFVVAAIVMGPYITKSVTAVLDPTNLLTVSGMKGAMAIYYLGFLLVLGPLVVGLTNAFKMLLVPGDNHVTANAFKIGFGNWLHNAWGYFLRGLFTFLWALLLIIPGIIKSLSYAMTNYILAEHPEMSANKAINLSKDMMYGHKFDLFYLYLSFIGWFLLAIFTLGIAYFWVIPYIQTAQASFYLDVKADWEARRAAATTAGPVPSKPEPEIPAAPPISEVVRKEENPEDYMPK